MGKYFGTDGIRGVVGEALTEEFALRLGGAAGSVLAARGRGGPTVVIGRDTRASGQVLEEALIEGLRGAGTGVIRAGVVPTPAVAYLAAALPVEAGVVISASHNPYQWNGIKFFDGSGFKLSDDLEGAIERALETGPPAPGDAPGRICPNGASAARYQKHLRDLSAIGLGGLRVVMDCAHGAAHEIAPTVFEALGARVITLHAEPTGININQRCGALHPQAMAQAVVEDGADLGLALDGDADRVILSDERGQVVDGDQVLAMCAGQLKEAGELPGDVVVGTQMSNLGLEIALREMGCGLVRTRVGDRYVLEEMQRRGAVLGGEPSGHTIFLRHATTGDGLLTAIMVTNLLMRDGTALSQLAGVMKRVPQTCVSVEVERRPDLDADPVIGEAIGSAESVLGDEGRVFVRPSGTEPVVRVMVEGLDRALVERLAREVAETIQARCV